MKTLTITLLMAVISFNMIGQTEKSGMINGPDSVVMGPQYANDIYYSLENGVVTTVSRNNWDIGFHTTVWSATIITNGGAGADLYTYPYADTSGWASVDTTGMAGWPMMYDDENEWENGAFSRNSAGHPDYGWGKYNPVTHDVVGDSLYILKTLDGTYKKIWILRKNSINNKYFIRYADLDGNNEKNIDLEFNPYRHKNFMYYDFALGSLVDREPDTASWDILFTRYMAIQPNGTPYGVIGVQNNFKVYANEFKGVGPDFTDWTNKPFDSTKSAIGWEWKSFDMNSFTWTVADSLAFFVKSRTHDIHKLVFTGFAGTASGRIFFEKYAVSPAVVSEMPSSGVPFRVFPNPVKDRLNILFNQEITGTVKVSLYDMTGRQVYQANREVVDHGLSLMIPTASVQYGMHLLKVTTNQGNQSVKIFIQPN